MKWRQISKLRAQKERPFIMAHRGASALLAENSRSAFEKALLDGADILETDLRFTKDGEIVLLHDQTLNRTVEGGGPVGEYSLQALKQHKIKQPDFRKGYDERIPTLLNLIKWTGGTIPLALELKDPLFTQPRYAEKLVSILEASKMIEKCAVISFSLERIQAVKRLCPDLACGWITLSNLSPNHPVEFLGPSWPLFFLNPFYIRQARKLGKIICPLDLVPEARVGLYLKWGFEIIMTNDPAVTLNVIAKELAKAA